MSAYEVTDRLVEAIDAGDFDFIVVNYANTDMVGHSGDLDAAIRAVEAVDRLPWTSRRGGAAGGRRLVVTADHGNAEMMRDRETGRAAHRPHPQPSAHRGGEWTAGGAIDDGRLADVAPTLLQIMGLPKPAEMTGRSLLRRRPAEDAFDASHRARV